jgi:hypothetical protein
VLRLGRVRSIFGSGFPHGLPKPFQGQHAPANPCTFTPLIAAAQQSCA